MPNSKDQNALGIFKKHAKLIIAAVTFCVIIGIFLGKKIIFSFGPVSITIAQLENQAKSPDLNKAITASVIAAQNHSVDFSGKINSMVASNISSALVNNEKYSNYEECYNIVKTLSLKSPETYQLMLNKTGENASNTPPDVFCAKLHTPKNQGNSLAH